MLKTAKDNFILISSAESLKTINPAQYELCIIKTDFKDMKIIKKYAKRYLQVEFWIASNDLSRENILSANNCGVKNVIPFPVDMNIVKDYFKQKSTNYAKSQFKENISVLKDFKVMIVDDNIMNVELLSEVLSQLNIEAKTFLKPAEAMDALQHEKFDLFLLDIMMPEISGFDLAVEIKNNHLNQDAAIMFVSALSDSEHKIAGYNLGSCAYIEKPFDVDIIKSQIYNVLKTKKLQESTKAAKETFVAMVTHDLKTPVNAEIRALELLMQNKLGDLTPTQYEIINDILNSAKYMKNMTDNLLCKYKTESGTFELSKESLSLKSLALECIDETKYILKEKNQKVVFDCKVEDAQTSFDYLEIKRVIQNLIANASEYAPKNSDIIVEIFRSENSIGFSVQDFGAGIDLPEPNDVFKKYLSLAKKQKKTGTGLGLYISKMIIEAHNGNIFIESKSGFGTKIIFVLPYTKV